MCQHLNQPLMDRAKPRYRDFSLRGAWLIGDAHQEKARSCKNTHCSRRALYQTHVPDPMR